ncbi:DUF951 domain-containing protein [Candidatus Chlorohelix sp.]|uniref:DUF951 domain-containing protein n=1 Tax=Candidatus Chlorohelix sp. TaxID=3139201 RepID=UPI0030461CF3
MSDQSDSVSPKPSKPNPAREVEVGHEIRLRKPHPCGSYDWRVVRVGADIGMRCLGCDRKVLLPRSEFERRFKAFINRQV